ncbi:MAG: GxxExxY protein [Bacillota bacterium]
MIGTYDMERYPHSNITRQILGAAFEVHTALGPGFLETIYEEALAKEFIRRGIKFRRQPEVPVRYKGE